MITAGAYLMGAMDNIINPLLAAWDVLESGIRKSWNRVQSLFKKGFNLKAENDKVKSEMDARKRQREIDRPGIEGRTEKAAKDNEKANAELEGRKTAVDANTEATIAERERSNELLRDNRRQAVVDAEGKVTALGRGSREKRAMNQQAEDLGSLIGKAGTLDSLRELSDEFHALTAAGRLTSEQQEKLSTAFDDATERIMGEGSTIAGGKKQVDPQALAAAAAAAKDSQSEVAGTFSAVAAGQMGVGQSLAQKQLDTLKTIEQITRPGDDGLVAA
jgi:hypothetical protein